MTDCAYELIDERQMNMALLSGLKSFVDRARQRINSKALVIPKQVAAKPVPPKFMEKTIEWQAPEQLVDLDIHEQLINAKRNRAHDKRMQMKKFHRKQARMNKQYRVRS